MKCRIFAITWKYFNCASSIPLFLSFILIISSKGHVDNEDRVIFYMDFVFFLLLLFMFAGGLIFPDTIGTCPSFSS
ncbi:hypothetical protein HMPREF1992_02267 [Selenomonas sp. oral taxon 892 str. F0426]|nr:hypothetical protein HMPREF1992_02267 [Selenomonas sp. oral taxon 892 str. F0426]